MLMSQVPAGDGRRKIDPTVSIACWRVGDSERMRRRRSFGCHEFHPISPRRCIVVLVDARNFRENANRFRRAGREMQDLSENPGPTCRGDLWNAANVATALFPACKPLISDLSSSTYVRSTTMELVSRGGSQRWSEPRGGDSTSVRRFAFYRPHLANTFHFTAGSRSLG